MLRSLSIGTCSISKLFHLPRWHTQYFHGGIGIKSSEDPYRITPPLHFFTHLGALLPREGLVLHWIEYSKSCRIAPPQDCSGRGKCGQEDKIIRGSGVECLMGWTKSNYRSCVIVFLCLPWSIARSMFFRIQENDYVFLYTFFPFPLFSLCGIGDSALHLL